jgi:MerR HTH family regulatory protein
MTRASEILEARVLGESDWIAAGEICELCRIDLAAVMELAALGVVTPRETRPGQWHVPATALPRLGINVSGAALALELLEAHRDLERRLRHLERLVGDY